MTRNLLRCCLFKFYRNSYSALWIFLKIAAGILQFQALYRLSLQELLSEYLAESRAGTLTKKIAVPERMTLNLGSFII